MKQRVVSGIRGIGITLGILAALYPLDDGNLLVKAVMVLSPLVITAIICWIIAKVWPTK